MELKKKATSSRTKRNKVTPSSKDTLSMLPSKTIRKRKIKNEAREEDDSIIRTVMKKHHISTLTLFITDWRGKTYVPTRIIPDPVEDVSDILSRRLREVINFILVFMMMLVTLNFNIVLHSVRFMSRSFVGHEARRLFFTDYQHYTSIWIFIFFPVVIASLKAFFMVNYNPKKWSKCKFVVVLLFRYLLIVLWLGCMSYLDYCWILKTNRVRPFIHDQIWTNFEEFMTQNNTAMTEIWTYTQRTFECCGVDSSQDFVDYKLGASYCVDPDCHKLYADPRIDFACPVSCCNSIEVTCVTNPLGDQSWPVGCMDKTVLWLKCMIGMIVATNCASTILIVITTVCMILIDLITHDEVKYLKIKELKSQTKYNPVNRETFKEVATAEAEDNKLKTTAEDKDITFS